MDQPPLNPLVVLGATGSIGQQTLAVARQLGVPVAALAARRGSDELAGLAKEFSDAAIGVTSPTEMERTNFIDLLGTRAKFGPECLPELAATPGATVVNGVVGAAGLEASVAALKAGNRLALANKESLVAGGPVVEEARIHGGGELIPVDSEHSALFQCLVGEELETVRRLILTASGGPFRGRTAEELAGVTVDEAMAHPTWSMGPRITVDSATLMNKAFEVIETHFLFGVGFDQIEVVVHPQSVIHSAVEFVDGSVKAQLGEPDMQLPIHYAITYPRRVAGALEPFSFVGSSLTFEEPDWDLFPLLGLGYQAGRRGGSAPATLNAADEIAVQAFIDGRIGFPKIAEVVASTLEQVPFRDLASVADVMSVDEEARAVAAHLVSVC